MKQKIAKLAITLAIIGLAFGTGYSIGYDEAEIKQPDEEVDLSLFWETYNNLQDHYVNPEEIKEEDVVHGAIRGMLDQLDDPHTSFYDQEESRQFLEDVSGYYQGVGMEVGMREEEIRVISPIEGTPASRAGLQSGDVIVEIDGESTGDMSLDEAVDMMRGEEGTSVEITVNRNGSVLDFDLERATIQIPSVDWELKNDTVGYLQIHYFHQDLMNEFNQIVPEVIESPAETLILDLRNNPGGSLDSALELAEYFLQEDEVIVKSQGPDGELEDTYKTQSGSTTLDQDLIILVNEGSASASEIIAEALRYHRGAKIVGETSFGKGSIQSMINMSEMTNLKVTVSHWVTPDGKVLAKEGVVPDYEVEMTVEDFEEEKDPQLDKALELIN